MDKNKKALAHLIICKIQNLLPDNCSVCNCQYRISLHESTILECVVCGQGVHKSCWLELATVQGDSIKAEQFKKIKSYESSWHFLYV